MYSRSEKCQNMLINTFFLGIYFVMLRLKFSLRAKKVREKSRECHNYKPQPRPQEEEETDKSTPAQTEQTHE